MNMYNPSKTSFSNEKTLEAKRSGILNHQNGRGDYFSFNHSPDYPYKAYNEERKKSGQEISSGDSTLSEDSRNSLQIEKSHRCFFSSLHFDVVDESFLVDKISNSRNFLMKTNLNIKNDEFKLINPMFRRNDTSEIHISSPNYSYYLMKPNTRQVASIAFSISEFNTKIAEEMSCPSKTSIPKEERKQILEHSDMKSEVKLNNLRVEKQDFFYRSLGLQTKQHYEVLKRILQSKQEITVDIHRILKNHYSKLFTQKDFSKIFQKCIQKTSTEVLFSILDEINEELYVLMVDQYANYLLPTIYDRLDHCLKLSFLQNICSDNVVHIAKDSKGTFSLQRIIDSIITPLETNIVVKALEPITMDLAFDSNGVHVLLKLLRTFPVGLTPTIYRILCDNFLSLSTNVYGNAVATFIIKSVKDTNQDRELVSQIKMTLLYNSLYLVKHIYGNYSIQTALNEWGASFATIIFNHIKQDIRGLSKHKSASRVLERCLEFSQEGIITAFVERICLNKTLLDMMKNKYANYVLKICLKRSYGKDKQTLLKALRTNVGSLNNDFIKAKWNLILDKEESDLQSQY